MSVQLGLVLRDAALAQSQRGREERIQAVREWLAQNHAFGSYVEGFTGDDIHDALEALGLDDGDTRWSGNVVKGWAEVSPTHHFVPSRRKERHGAPLRVWRFR